jgi:hypothetical protein
MSNVLNNFAMDRKVLNRRITTVANKLATASGDVQEVLVATAAQIEAHNNCDGLTKLVVALSKENSKGSIILSSHAKQIGLYMQDVCPIFWDKDSQAFKIQKKAAKDFDWSNALAKFDTPWHEFGAQQADKAFDAYAKMRAALAAVQAVVNAEDEIDHRLRSEAETLLAKMGGVEKLLGQIKDEKAAAKKAA